MVNDVTQDAEGNDVQKYVEPTVKALVEVLALRIPTMKRTGELKDIIPAYSTERTGGSSATSILMRMWSRLSFRLRMAIT